MDRRQLTDRLEELRGRQREPWEIWKVPHEYPDGTTHFTHVRCVTHDSEGTPMNVVVGRYLTPDLAELLCLLRNNLDEISAALRASNEALYS